MQLHELLNQEAARYGAAVRCSRSTYPADAYYAVRVENSHTGELLDIYATSDSASIRTAYLAVRRQIRGVGRKWASYPQMITK